MFAFYGSLWSDSNEEWIHYVKTWFVNLPSFPCILPRFHRFVLWFRHLQGYGFTLQALNDDMTQTHDGKYVIMCRSLVSAVSTLPNTTLTKAIPRSICDIHRHQSSSSSSSHSYFKGRSQYRQSWSLSYRMMRFLSALRTTPVSSGCQITRYNLMLWCLDVGAVNDAMRCFVIEIRHFVFPFITR